MKKILSLVLCVLMLVSVVSLVGCGGNDDAKDTEKNAETLKFGLGVVAASSEIKSASDEADGSAKAAVTVASVLLDKDGKVVKCVVDTAENKVTFTNEGKANDAQTFKTKYDLGEDYGMKKAGSKKEWFEQADAFSSVVVGKNIDEIKALVTNEGKGNTDVVNAGCTIFVSDFVKAVVAACENAKDSDATADDALKLGIISSQANKADATEEKAGSNGFETNIAASVIDSDKKVVANAIDTVAFKVTFDSKGITEVTTGDITSKRQLGENYGMKKAGSKKEWFEQADALSTIIVGKTASEIEALVAAEGKGNDDVVAAGCTIAVSDIVKAVVASAK